MGDDLADMQLIRRFNKRIRYLLCVIDIFRRYSWVVPLREKEELKLLMPLRKPNKIWVDKGS